ncbi:MAG: Histidine kinase protein [Acidobacteriota bacterium]|nr:Histidine kinase protein [Acidobacteriota bacterium]
MEENKSGGRFSFQNALRIAILSILIVVSIFLAVLAETPFSFAPIFIALAAAIGLSILNFKLFKRFDYRVVLYFQSLVDIALITLLVYYSGGITSPFYFLYIFPIITAASFLTRRDTIYIATFSYIVFGVLSDLIYLEIIPYYPLIASINITLNVFIYNLVMSFVAFSSIAILSSYYFDRIRKTGAALKNARENLKDLMLLNNTVLEKMENGFVVSDAKGTIISYNEKSRVLLKLNSSSNIFDLLSLSPVGSLKIGGTDAQIDSDGEDGAAVSDLNKKLYFEVEVNNRVLGVSHSIIENIYSFDKVYVFIVTDLTDKREIEKRLKQKERLALIGEMSAGIAHEIRNPLASISGSVQFLSKELKLDTEYQNLMDIIVKESGRLSNSIEVFLDYARPIPLKLVEFDLSQAVDDVSELIALNYPGVKLVKKYSEGNLITADIKKIDQVIWNLINNSVKAVNEDGVIEINIYGKDGEIYLSIKDNGVGIAGSEMARIFTPFYSKFSSGIGLGMAIVKRIIDEHNFDIKIISEKNIGTEVIICFKGS